MVEEKLVAEVYWERRCREAESEVADLKLRVQTLKTERDLAAERIRAVTERIRAYEREVRRGGWMHRVLGLGAARH